MVRPARRWDARREATEVLHLDPEGTDVTCPACGADLASPTTTTCPTCGHQLAPSAAASGTAGAPPQGFHPAPVPVWGQAQATPHPSGLTGELRGWGIGAHLSGLGAGLATAAVFGWVGPLIVWLIKRDEHPFTDHHAKEALNFQLTVLVWLAAAALLAIPAVIVGVVTLGLGLLLIGAVVLAAVVAWFVFPIMAAIKASNGEGYRYPLTIRFVR
jgi:uncharacterized protein